jgi:RNA polymerase sigma-70 factor, ECF subfamily
MSQSTPSASVLSSERRRLLALAYRLLGSTSDAEDVVQEALARASQRDDLKSPPAFLTTVVTHLCLDEQRSARRRKVHYVGPYLPEPIPTDRLDAPSLADVEYRESVSIAFMLLLDQLSAPERAVYVLRELFDVEMREIAATLERTEASCRKLLERARAHIEAGRRQRVPTSAAQQDIANAFFFALATGDLAGLCALLAEDAKALTDHGGTAKAALRTIEGADDVARFFLGLAEKSRRAGSTYTPTFLPLSGQPGVLLRNPDGTIESALVIQLALRPCADFGRVVIDSVYSIRDVQKLETLRRELDAAVVWSVTPPRD